MTEPSGSDPVARALAELAGTPPAPMPPQVAARLHARLAAEQHTAQRPPPWRRPLVLAAAGLAAVAVLTGVVLSARSGASRRASSASTAASAAVRAPATAPGSRTRYLATGRRYTAGSLAGAAMLTAQPAQGAASLTAIPLHGLAGALPAAAPPRAGSPLARCLAALAPTPGSQPLVVDRAYFRGRPALIVVEPGTRGRVGIYVVSPSCSGAVPHVRYFQSVPRPG